jgi:hypothetical protein
MHGHTIIKKKTEINVYRSSCKAPGILVGFQSNLSFLYTVLKTPQVSSFMKIRPVGAALFHTNRRTDGHEANDLFRLISFTNFNAQFLYSLTICMLHYNPRHVLSINMPIFRRTNCIITASGIVTFCKLLYSIPDESRQKNTKI